MADNNNDNNNNNAAGDNSNETPAIHQAAALNNVEELKRLIEEEGHFPTLLHQLVQQIEGGEDFRYTVAPLNLAVMCGATEAVSYLLEDCKVDPNIANNVGDTAIHQALNTRRTDCLRLLLKHGADLNAPTADCDSPLMVAVQNNHEESLLLLLEHGDCDLNYTDDIGLCALRSAIYDKNWHFAKILLEHGARPFFFTRRNDCILWLDELLEINDDDNPPKDFVKMAKAIVGEAERTNLLSRYRQIQNSRYDFITVGTYSRGDMRIVALTQLPRPLVFRILDGNCEELNVPKPLPRVTLSPLPPPPRRSKRKRTEAEVEEEERKMKEKETCLSVLEYTLGVQEKPMWVTEREEEREGRPRRRMIDDHYIELMEMMLPAWDDNEHKRGKKALK